MAYMMHFNQLGNNGGRNNTTNTNSITYRNCGICKDLLDQNILNSTNYSNIMCCKCNMPLNSIFVYTDNFYHPKCKYSKISEYKITKKCVNGTGKFFCLEYDEKKYNIAKYNLYYMDKNDYIRKIKPIMTKCCKKITDKKNYRKIKKNTFPYTTVKICGLCSSKFQV